MENQENNLFENEYNDEHMQEFAPPEQTEEVAEQTEAAAVQEEVVAEQTEATPTSAHQGNAPVHPGYYSNTGTGRRESPFAQSPYVMRRQNFEQPAPYSKPRKPKAQKDKTKKPGSGKVWKSLTAAAVAVALVGSACGITAAVVNSRWENKAASMEQVLNQKIADLQKRIEDVAAKPGNPGVSGNTVSSGGMTPGQVYAQNVDSVVAISNQSTTNVYGQISETASSGSGFIISEDGYVVSNYHVVEGATTLTVITFDGTEYPAELVGYDQGNDISLLKVDATGLQPVAIGSSDELIVGDQVVAIGNPLGELTSTLTVGYVSAKDRTINTDGTYLNMMQTDAAINSGNSGGPLFNMRGEVIGITTAKYSGASNSGATIEGIGFAIPIDDVIGMLTDLRDLGYVTGAYMGISVRTLDASVADVYSLPTGSLVDSVEEGSCAEKAGIQPQDIIIGMGGYKVNGNSDLTRALRKFKAGDTTTVTVYRGGQQLDLTITLDEKPEPVQETTEPTLPTMPSDQSQMPMDGNPEDWFNYFAPFFGFGGR